MITLHIAKLLEDEGFGTLEQDIFWDDMPVNAAGKPVDGIWIVTRGAPLTRFDITTQDFDIFSRYANKITGAQILEDILGFLKNAYGQVCELPEVPPYSYTRYYDVMLTPTSGIENVGIDQQNKVVRVISGEIKYKKEQ